MRSSRDARWPTSAIGAVHLGSSSEVASRIESTCWHRRCSSRQSAVPARKATSRSAPHEERGVVPLTRESLPPRRDRSSHASKFRQREIESRGCIRIARLRGANPTAVIEQRPRTSSRWGLACDLSALMVCGCGCVRSRTHNAGIVDVAWSASIGALGVAWRVSSPTAGVPRRLADRRDGRPGRLRLGWHLCLRVGRRARGRAIPGNCASASARRSGRAETVLVLPGAGRARGTVQPCALLVGRDRPTDARGLARVGHRRASRSSADRHRRRVVADSPTRGMARRTPSNRGRKCAADSVALLAPPELLLRVAALVGLRARSPSARPWWWVALWPARGDATCSCPKVTGIPPTEQQALRSRGDAYRPTSETTNAFFPKAAVKTTERSNVDPHELGHMRRLAMTGLENPPLDSGLLPDSLIRPRHPPPVEASARTGHRARLLADCEQMARNCEPRRFVAMRRLRRRRAGPREGERAALRGARRLLRARCLGRHRKYSSCSLRDPETTNPRRRGGRDAAHSPASGRSSPTACASSSSAAAGARSPCGWRSTTRTRRITAVSNSSSQQRALHPRGPRRGLSNVEVITARHERLRPPRAPDRSTASSPSRCSSTCATGRTAPASRPHSWLKRRRASSSCTSSPTRASPTRSRSRDESDWMSRYFFTGGMMPCRTTSSTSSIALDRSRSSSTSAGSRLRDALRAHLRGLAARTSSVDARLRCCRSSPRPTGAAQTPTCGSTAGACSSWPAPSSSPGTAETRVGRRAPAPARASSEGPGRDGRPDADSRARRDGLREMIVQLGSTPGPLDEARRTEDPTSAHRLARVVPFVVLHLCCLLVLRGSAGARSRSPSPSAST